jgi:fumarate reductase flavoprotein subunit
VRLSPKWILSLLVVGLAAITFTIESSGSEGPLLLQKHLDKGAVCSGCHQENPPAKPVTEDKCLACHGTYEQLAKKTEGKNAANPHASHNGDISCDSCHHVHKASENYCAQCHQFEFKVP